MPHFSLHLEDQIAFIYQIKLPMPFHVKCHFSMGSDLWKNYSYSSINYLDKNLIKLFLTSCCKGGVSNSHQLPELAFVRFSFSRAWELQSFKSLCERSPPMEQHKKCYTEVALPVPYAEEQLCCVHNSSDQSPHEDKIYGHPQPRLPTLKFIYHECWTAGAVSSGGKKPKQPLTNDFWTQNFALLCFSD